MYTLEQLKIFVAVCEHGSLSAAARALGRAQSGISQSIANLEIELDQTLFVREKAGVTLTEAGQALLPEAQALLRQNHYFEQRLQAIAQGEGHELSLAVEISVWNDGMADALARLERRFSYLPVKLLTASTFDIAQMVENGDVQLGVVYKDLALQKDADFVFLGYNRFIAVAAPEHPLAQAQSITPAQLLQHRQIAQRSLSGQELGFSSTPSTQAWYVHDHYSLMDLALRGIGWADVPEKIAETALNSGRLVRLPLDFEPDGNLIPIIALRARSHPATPAQESLIADLQTVFAP